MVQMPQYIKENLIMILVMVVIAQLIAVTVKEMAQ